MSIAFPPPDAPAALYHGQVMHARMKPKAHRFTYSVYNLLIDIDALPQAHAVSRFFSIGRFNLLSFQPADHGDGRTQLGDHVRKLLHDAGLSDRPKRILLLCYPRVLGFVFNPISVYFAYGASDRLIGIVYEVRNTFGDIHTYVAPVADGELSEAGVRQERSKLLHVSPFMDMPMRYRFRLRAGRRHRGPHSRDRRRRPDPRRDLHRPARAADDLGRAQGLRQRAAAHPQGRGRHPLRGHETLVQGRPFLRSPDTPTRRQHLWTFHRFRHRI
jgi:hypothetical protein